MVIQGQTVTNPPLYIIQNTCPKMDYFGITFDSTESLANLEDFGVKVVPDMSLSGYILIANTHTMKCAYTGKLAKVLPKHSTFGCYSSTFKISVGINNIWI